jgi:NAD+ kinase
VRILLVPNTANPNAVAAAVELATWCGSADLDPVLSVSDATACGLDAFGVAPSELGKLTLVVALGGDGTILKAVHLIGEDEVPLLGVKFGRLGFLSGARPDNMRDAVEAALAGDVRIERRATLSARVVMEGREVGSYRALNEVVLTRGESGRVVSFEVAVGGHTVARTRADGVIVATATGSTAYALSAGGPVVAPGFGGMVVVPVAPHTLQSRAVLTDPAETVEISLPDHHRSDARVVVDGEPVPSRRAIDKVVVCRGEHDVLLAKLDGRDFYETVAEEFFGSR